MQQEIWDWREQEGLQGRVGGGGGTLWKQVMEMEMK